MEGDEFENELRTIIEERGPDTIMSHAIDIYVDNNGKQLGVAIWNRYNNKSSDEMKQSMDWRNNAHWGPKQRHNCMHTIQEIKNCRRRTKHSEEESFGKGDNQKNRDGI